MERPCYMSFDIRNYKNEQAMMADISTVMATLVRNDYECLFYYDDCGIYVLQYANHNRELGTPYFEYMTEDEEFELNSLREDKKE